ncbi:MAG: SDR family oxidoreductase [bacterium]|nr:SDR family oxidoreductase [bacterium]
MGCALVTGAGRRLGLAMARALAADGWPVALAARKSFAEACAEARDITGRGGRALAIRGDLADRQTPARVVREAMEALGPVTLLVNNAAVFIDDSVRTAGPDTIDANIHTNLVAPMLLTRAFSRQLPSSAQGCVINLLDQRVSNPTPRYMSYTASKVALEAMTRTWALELAPAVRVNGIAPGMALPDHRSDDAAMDRWTAGFPLGRGTSPEEICDTLRFLIQAPSVTGQVIHLDGGQRLGWQHPAGGYPLGPDVA